MSKVSEFGKDECLLESQSALLNAGAVAPEICHGTFLRSCVHCHVNALFFSHTGAARRLHGAVRTARRFRLALGVNHISFCTKVRCLIFWIADS